jgi:hypothetical protein
MFGVPPVTIEIPSSIILRRIGNEMCFEVCVVITMLIHLKTY